MARRGQGLVDSGKPRGGRLPRGPNPRTSLARRLLRSPCATPHVRCRAEGFHLGARRARAARARPQARNASESGDDSDGRQGRTASLDARGLQPPAPLSGRPRVVGPPHRADRGHRRPEPGQVARVRRGRHHLRHPRWRDPAGVRPADGLHQGPAHPRPARAGRRSRGRGLRVGHRQGRGVHGHQRAGRHEPGHADRQRLHGLGAMVAITGQVSSASIGTDAFQEADIRGITMPITKHNYLVTDPALIPRAIAEAFHIASTGRPGPVLVDISKDALQATHHLRVAAEDRAARLPPGRPAAQQADPRGRPADRAGPSPRAVRRWRHHPLGRQRPAAPLPRADPDPGGHHPDGPRGGARQPPAQPGYAGHARHRLGGHRAAEVRPAGHPRRPVRRPRHRPAVHLRPRGQGDPRRHRPGRDQQEPHRGRADRGRLQGRDHRPHRRRERRAGGRQGR